MSNNIIVLVPGYTATKLEKNGKQVWPLTKWEKRKFAFIRCSPNGKKNAKKYLTNLIGNNELKATEVPQKQDKKDTIYAQMADYFQTLGHYSNVLYEPGIKLNSGENLFIQLPYDWRRTNAYTTDDGNKGQGSAVTLNQALTDIHKQLGNDINLYLVAHSMGGLVSRALLESEYDQKGNTIDKPWKSRLMGLFTLGTPHLGAPEALKAICGELAKKYHYFYYDFTIIPGSLIQALIDMPDYSGGSELVPYFKADQAWNFISNDPTGSGDDWLGLNSEIVQNILETNPKYKVDFKSQNWRNVINLFSNLNYKNSTPTGYGTGASPLPYHCLYSNKYTTKKGKSGETCYEFKLENQNLNPVDGTEKGDCLVTPYSASFGQVTQYDCNGSEQLFITGVSAKDFSGDSHFQLPKNEEISRYIISIINSQRK